MVVTATNHDKDSTENKIPDELIDENDFAVMDDNGKAVILQIDDVIDGIAEYKKGVSVIVNENGDIKIDEFVTESKTWEESIAFILIQKQIEMNMTNLKAEVEKYGHTHEEHVKKCLRKDLKNTKFNYFDQFDLRYFTFYIV